jgi:hypothetical protein
VPKGAPTDYNRETGYVEVDGGEQQGKMGARDVAMPEVSPENVINAFMLKIVYDPNDCFTGER